QNYRTAFLKTVGGNVRYGEGNKLVLMRCNKYYEILCCFPSVNLLFASNWTLAYLLTLSLLAWSVII
ncbi:MAG: hypothetical protein ACXU9L_04705, partial [Thermodesulfobacteriota bacterium]